MDDVPIAESGKPYFTLHNQTLFTDGRPSGIHRWGEMVVPMTTGDLAGFTARLRLELDDGRIKLANITYEPAEWADIDRATNRALRAVSLGNVIDDMETCLRHMSEHQWIDGAVEWFDALQVTRKRPGQKGRPPVQWARVAERRVDAENKSAGRSTHYMITTWPDEFTSKRSVWGKVNRAIDKGMLEFDTDGKPHLTERARQLLDPKEDS